MIWFVVFYIVAVVIIILVSAVMTYRQWRVVKRLEQQRKEIEREMVQVVLQAMEE